MKLVYTVHKLLFLKETNMCLPFPQRFEKYLLIKVDIKGFIWIHLQTTKISSTRIRSKIGIPLEIILNVFKCFIV